MSTARAVFAHVMNPLLRHRIENVVPRQRRCPQVRTGKTCLHFDQKLVYIFLYVAKKIFFAGLVGWPELTKGRRVFGVLKGDKQNVPCTKNCHCTFQIQQSKTHTQDVQDVESHGVFVRISYV